MPNSRSIVIGALLVGLAAIGLGDAFVAYRAGDQFKNRLESLSNQPIGSPALSLTGIVVDRGWFRSSATALLLVTGKIGNQVAIPLVLHATQGFALDGSAMRVKVHMGAPSDSIVAAALAVMHDPDPVSADIAFNLAGQPMHAALQIAPMMASIPIPGGAHIRFQWGGGHSSMNIDGFYSPQGGSLEGRATTLPWSLHIPQVAVTAFMGKSVESFNETGKPFDLKGSTQTTIGESGVRFIKIGKEDVIKTISIRSNFSLRRPSGNTNDSGLNGGKSSITNLRAVALVTKPSVGQIIVTGNIQFIAPSGPYSVQTGGNGPALREAILKSLQGNLHLRISHTLLAQNPPPLIRLLLARGFLRRDGGYEVADIVLRNGAASVNGIPVLPTPEPVNSAPMPGGMVPFSGPPGSGLSTRYATRLAQLVRLSMLSAASRPFPPHESTDLLVALNAANGEVLRVRVIHRSGDPQWDNAAVMAVTQVGAFPADQDGQWVTPVGVRVSSNQLGRLQVAVYGLARPLSRPIPLGSAKATFPPMPIGPRMFRETYQRRVLRIIAMRMHSLRVAQERNLIAQTGHAVPLATGLCGARIDIAPNGAIQGIHMSYCKAPALGEIERQAITEGPLPPPGVPAHIRIMIDAPLATPGADP